jgi:hypothetical protein
MKNSLKTWFLLFAGFIALSISCSKKEDEDEETVIETPLTEGASSAVKDVNDTMIPGSLVLSTSLHLEGDNPCANTDGFFDCQPNLLKLYLSMGQSMTETMQTIVSAMGAGLKNLKEGTSGKFEDNDPEAEIASVEYKITTATDYSLFMNTKKGPFIYLAVKDNKITLKMNGANAIGDDDGEMPDAVSAEIDYTDKDNYSVSVVIAGMACDPDDVQAPSNIAIDIVRTEGTNQGKAMMYLPRWRGDNSCSTTPSSDTEVFIYTDFVGDDTNSTGALYMMDASVTSAGDFSSWEASDFCGNFDNVCSNGGWNGEVIADYKNNFCVTGEDTAWNTTCDSDNELISTPTFSSSKRWILPEAFKDYEAEFPDAL